MFLSTRLKIAAFCSCVCQFRESALVHSGSLEHFSVTQWLWMFHLCLSCFDKPRCHERNRVIKEKYRATVSILHKKRIFPPFLLDSFPVFSVYFWRLSSQWKQSLPLPPARFIFSASSSPSVLISLQTTWLVSPDKQHYYPPVTPSTVYLVNGMLDPKHTLISYAIGPINTQFMCTCVCVCVFPRRGTDATNDGVCSVVLHYFQRGLCLK